MSPNKRPIQQKPQEKFNFFVPFEKGNMKVDDNGDLIVEGEASDNTKDADGEYLDPLGFDCTPLLSTGVINWNHQAKKDPGAIIGEPIEAYVNKAGKFYVKGKLYKDDPLARATYDKAKVLEKNSSTRRFGWSIEGIPIEKDPLNPKKIRRALITGVAITHCPKNANTWVSIVKGDYDQAYVHSLPDMTTLVSEYNDWTGINEGRNKDFYGKEHSVKEFLQNNYEDNMDLAPELMKTLKAMDTAAMAPVTPESVEGQHKTLTKSDVYLSIIKNFDVDLQKAKDIFHFIQTVQQQFFPQMTNTAKGISNEVIEKAFSILKDAAAFEKSLETENTSNTTEENKPDTELGKTENTEAVVEKSQTKVNEFKASESFDGVELKKAAQAAYEKSGEAGYEEFATEHIRKGCSMGECQGAWQSVVAEMNAKKDGGDITGLGGSIAKSNDAETTTKETAPVIDMAEFNKSLDGTFGRFEHLFKAQTEFFSEKFNALATINQGQQEIIKAQTDKIDTLEKSLNSTLQANNSLVEKLNSLPTRGRGIINQRQVVDRSFEKSQDGEGSKFAKGEYDIAVPAQRRDLMDRLEQEPDYKSNRSLQQVVEGIEMAKSIDASGITILRSRGYNAFRSIPLQ